MTADGAAAARAYDGRVAGRSSPETRWIEVAGGVRLHALDWGGGGAPVVFLPGLGQSAHVFRALAPALGEGFRTVALTPRAHGESGTPETGYSLAAFSGDGLAAMDALGIGRASVVAHSISVAVAARMAVDAPERIARMAFLDGPTDYAGIGRVQARNPARPPVLRPGAEDAAEREWQRTYHYGIWTDAVEADWLARPPAAVRAHRRELLIDLLDDAARTPPRWSALTMPLLSLFADETMATQYPWLAPDDPRRPAAEAYLREVRGPWRRATLDRLLAEAPDARAKLVSGNHFFFLAAPDATAAHLREFLLSPRHPGRT